MAKCYRPFRWFRRQFVDVINHFPEEVEHILHRYGEIWTHEHHIAEQQLSLVRRLEYHQTHSLPIMAEIKLWGETHLAEETIEENSGLGTAIKYFIKHYEGLSLFCHVAGAKIDNNAIEAMLITQMTATHVAITSLSRQVMDAGTSYQIREALEWSSTRLSRTYLAQIKVICQPGSMPTVIR